jgi:hypothetical protein
MSRKRRTTAPSRPAAPKVGRSLGTQAAVASYGLQFFLAAAAYYVMGQHRLMDPDEGHFLSAIHSTYDGLAPCRDFFYQQTPLFPYPYAAAMRLFGYGYEPCLWVSVLCGAGLSVVTAAYFTHHSGRIAVGWIGWLLIVLNAPILFWMPTVKNHAMPLFFGGLALYAASHRVNSARSAFGWGALAGLAAMASVGTRLLAAPFAAAAGLWILCRALPRSRPAGAAWGVAGFVVGILPPALLCLRSALPDLWVFYFDILGFHKIRSGSAGTYGNVATITAELQQMLFQGQFPAMLLVALGTAIWQITRFADPAVPRPGKWISAGLWLFGVFAAALALVPYETFHQYFMVPLIFLIFATVPLWQRLVAARNRLAPAAAILLVIAAYGVIPWNGSMALFNHRETVFPQFPEERSRESVRILSRELARVTGPDDLIFSGWQGFTFFADRHDIRGNENFNARKLVASLSPDELRRLHIVSEDELGAMLGRAEPKAIVLGFFWGHYAPLLLEVNPETHKPRFKSELLRHYQLVEQIGNHYLFVRP